MKKVIVPFALVLTFLAGQVLAQRQTIVVKVAAQARPSTVALFGPKGVAGTAFVVREDGVLLTCAHCVGSKKEVKVRLADGRELTAKVLTSVPEHDVAVLKVSVKDKLPALPLAQLDDLQVGETVIAIGNPFGELQSVTAGVVSGKGRTIGLNSGVTLTGLVQTDAAINPGNSGSPLLNADGDVVGMVCAIHNGANCMAYAVNAAVLREYLQQAKQPKFDPETP